MKDPAPKSVLILQTLVGSRAHGLADENSDYDYRGVFVYPTVEILKLRRDKLSETSWIEGENDNVTWELGHFLKLAVNCDPNVLEVFLAPTIPVKVQHALFGIKLQELFPHVWSSKRVYEAFVGYSENQRTKLFNAADVNDSIKFRKFATAYIRSLYQAYELLETGTYTVRVADTQIGRVLKNIRQSPALDVGEIMNVCREWRKRVEEAYKANPNKETDMDKVQEFLLEVRKEFYVF